MESKKLRVIPLTAASIEIISSERAIYVDKTEQIYGLLQDKTSSQYFLARPRRFGKSLLVDVIKQLFLGKKTFFKETWIYNSDWSWVSRSVLHFDMSKVPCDSPEALSAQLIIVVQKMAQEYGIDFLNFNNSPGVALELIIDKLSKDKKVVILVDEYDYAIVSNIENPELALKMREILKSFYTVLKSCSASLEFVFITGVSKFSQTSLHSGMNQLIDLTLDPRAASLVGYTEAEVDKYFSEYIEKNAGQLNLSVNDLREKIKEWYNGYRFSNLDVKVYNPFSLNRFLYDGEFINHWFSSGNPSFLFKLMKEQDIDIRQIENKALEREMLLSFDVRQIDIEVLLYQTGYLTIVDYDPELGEFTLNFPNKEVRDSFYRHFIYSYTGKVEASASITRFIARNIKIGFVQNDLQKVMDGFYELFLSINYDLHIPLEKFYQTIFFVTLRILGFDIKTEVKTNIRRIDAVVESLDRIFIIEFKINKSAKEALAQIETQKYYDKFLNQGKEVVIVGVSFNTEQRNIDKESWVCKVVH